MNPLRHQRLVRYITPLREGGSLPALAEADDGFKYVVKFKGAGHGNKALIAELIGGEVARSLGFRVPELVFLDLSEEFGRTEPDEEVQDLLKGSRGVNLGLHYLAGSFTVDPYVNGVDEMTASKIVWLDSFLTNVDRTVKNTNMLMWHNELWLIDHGASLYFHHNSADWEAASLTPFHYIRDHALLQRASKLEEADRFLRQRITPRTIEKIVNQIPDNWLTDPSGETTPGQWCRAYTSFLTNRLRNSNIFLKAAIDARKSLI